MFYHVDNGCNMDANCGSQVSLAQHQYFPTLRCGNFLAYRDQLKTNWSELIHKWRVSRTIY